MEQTLLKGTTTGCEITDITNAILQGAGFVLRSFKDPLNVTKAMQILDETSKMIESMTITSDFRRMTEVVSICLTTFFCDDIIDYVL